MSADWPERSPSASPPEYFFPPRRPPQTECVPRSPCAPAAGSHRSNRQPPCSPDASHKQSDTPESAAAHPAATTPEYLSRSPGRASSPRDRPTTAAAPQTGASHRRRGSPFEKFGGVRPRLYRKMSWKRRIEKSTRPAPARAAPESVSPKSPRTAPSSFARIAVVATALPANSPVRPNTADSSIAHPFAAATRAGSPPSLRSRDTKTGELFPLTAVGAGPFAE